MLTLSHIAIKFLAFFSSNMKVLVGYCGYLFSTYSCLQYYLTSNMLNVILQMSDDNPYVIPEMDPTLRKQIQECNWQVVNVTTPANYFHVLRRQVTVSKRIVLS